MSRIINFAQFIIAIGLCYFAMIHVSTATAQVTFRYGANRPVGVNSQSNTDNAAATFSERNSSFRYTPNTVAPSDVRQLGDPRQRYRYRYRSTVIGPSSEYRPDYGFGNRPTLTGP